MTERITRAELLRLRLRSQGLVSSERPPTPVDAVRRLFALQGQDLPGALWSIGQRTDNATRDDVVAAFNSGELVRTWPFRGTLHVMESANLGWVRELTASRTIAAMAARERGLGITNAALDDARRAAKELLSGARSAGRREFSGALSEAGVDTTGQRGIHLLQYLCLDGTLVLGPIAGTEQKIVLTDEWIPAPSKHAPDDVMRELVTRYLAAHGPAREDDIAGWAKLPLGMIRAGLDSGASELIRFAYGRQTLWGHQPTLDTVAATKPAAVLALPGFDELLLGYKDRSASLAPEHAPMTVPGNNGMFRPTIVSRGRVVGLWARKAGATKTTVTATPLAGEFSGAAAIGLQREIRRYGRFLQSPTELTITS